MIKFIKTLILIFSLFFTFHSFAKANENYQHTITNILTTCDAECKRKIFEEEINLAFINLFEAVLKQMQFELKEMKRDKLWLKNA
jgi:hypothetical protein